jgi:hypothetical protein
MTIGAAMNGSRKLIVGVMLGAAVVGAGIARADDQDVQFLDLLDQHGIATHDESLAHAICTDLDGGKSPFQEVNKVNANTALDRDKSMWFVALSMKVYCPWHGGQDYYEHRPMGGVST